MKAEIVGVGTELLLGQIVNTNAQKISRALADIGVGVYFHSVVGDNLERGRDTLSAALERSDVVIVTGGLGPTPDDVTREMVAATFGRDLVRDERLVEVIRGFFASIGRDMPEENLKQADLPEGAVAIDPEGTAPGFYIEDRNKFVAALPGVPWEMQAMLDKTILPILRERAGAGTIVSREIHVIGLGESATHEKIKDIVAAQTTPTIAYLSSKGQVRVRLTAREASEAAALAVIDPVAEQIRGRLGNAAVAGFPESLATAVGALLRERKETIAVVESLTGGLIGAELTAQPGASDYFIGSLVCYTDEAKRAVAGIDPAILDGPGAVSAECAGALAEAAVARVGADLGLAATGVAGPSEQSGIPAGTIFVAAAYRGRTESRKVRGYGDRDNVRAVAVTSALDLGRRMLEA